MATLEVQILALLSDKHPEYDYAASGAFIDDGLLDSFDIVLLTAELEATFGIVIPGEAILPENFSSVAAIAALARSLGADGRA